MNVGLWSQALVGKLAPITKVFNICDGKSDGGQ